MGVLGRLFGTDKAVDDILDKDDGLVAKAGEWLGNQQFTEEEKAEHRLKTREWGLKQLEALEPFKVVQRILAFVIIAVWAILALNCVAGLWFDALHPGINLADKMLALASNDVIFWPTVSVLSLYFSGGVIESIKRKL
jgi:hypothetical protein